MISWMQKHNKYLVWTIWVATITFIGAGFVGWGSYKFGSKASAIAKVGDVPIKQTRFNMVYSNLYERYRELYQGNFDDEKAKQMGLTQQAFAILATQAKLLNYAHDIGITVSDEEVAAKLQSIEGFQNNGRFDKSIYDNYLKRRGLRAKTFEETLRDEIAVEKLRSLIELDALPFEVESLTAGMQLADKIRYRIVDFHSVTAEPSEEDIKRYWEEHKNEFLTPKRYTLAVVWIDANATQVDDNELRDYYQAHNFDYIDAEGKTLSFDAAKEQVTRDVKIKKTKKTAQLAYIDVKKGKRQADKVITLDEDSPMLSKEAWDAVKQSEKGNLLKPKIIGNRYAVIRVVDTIEPHPMSYDEAKYKARAFVTHRQRTEKLTEISQKILEHLDDNTTKLSDYLRLTTNTPLEGLNSAEMSIFLQKLFTTQKEKGIITLSGKNIVYAIVDQKLTSDENNASLSDRQHSTTAIKNSVFRTHLIETLDRRYPTEVYVKGLTL